MVEIVRRLPLELRQRVYAQLTRGAPTVPYGWLVDEQDPPANRHGAWCHAVTRGGRHCWRCADASELATAVRSQLPAGWTARIQAPGEARHGKWFYTHTATRTATWAWPQPRYDWVLDDPATTRPAAP